MTYEYHYSIEKALKFSYQPKSMNPPTLKDIFAAQQRIKSYLTPTHLHTYPTLNEYIGFKTYVKHENHQPTGAFKIRGGINLISQLSSEEKRAGVITASTGNHGQSIALASSLFDVNAYICVPEGANPNKVAAIRNYGAEIIEKGKDFDDARLNAEKLSVTNGYRYIHSGNEPLLIAGVGTIGLEIIQQEPEIEIIISPVGAGTGCGGTGIAVKALNPNIQMVAVQAENAPSVYRSWISGKLESTSSANTMADGLATRQAFKLPVSLMRKNVDEFVLVSEYEMENAVRLYLKHCHTVAEGAGAASLAAALKLKDKLEGRKVAVVLSGGNLEYNKIVEIVKK
jgi:threonine dehydratase